MSAAAPAWSPAATGDPARHQLRAAAAEAGVRAALGGPLPHGRRLTVAVADGAVRGEVDTSARWRGRLLIAESPAPLADRLRQRMHAAALEVASAAGLSAVEIELVIAGDEPVLIGAGIVQPGASGRTPDAASRELPAASRGPAASSQRPAAASQPPAAGDVRFTVTIAAGEPLAQARVVDGRCTGLDLPAGVVTDLALGARVRLPVGTPLARFAVAGRDRASALATLRRTLDRCRIDGVPSDLVLLRAVAADPGFAAGLASARSLDALAPSPLAVEVLAAGTHTTVQDWPGRLGRWDVGVPPSGPMDDLAFRLANHLVGNPPDAAGFECTLAGPTLRFHAPAIICLAGPAYGATLAGAPLPAWRAVAVPAGAVLRVGAPTGPGCRAALALRGGIDVPTYLGSRATFDLGGFGGHAGRPLAVGDLVPLARACPAGEVAACPPPLPFAARPNYGSQTGGAGGAAPCSKGPQPGRADHGAAGSGPHRVWTIGVLEGPHAAPDFFTPADMRELYAATYTVHHNSNRTGVRLIGPKPRWARADGGEAGLHPSNIHDNAYAVGAIDFTGDMPILLGPDGPSLGGFVCPAVTVAAERWKLGQLRAGDRVRFQRLTPDRAERRRAAQDRLVVGAPPPRPCALPVAPDPGEAVIARRAAAAQRPPLCLRRCGDDYLLIEYGAPVLDLALRLRAHLLQQALAARALPGVIDLTPGIRSLQVHFDPARLPLARLIDLVGELDDDLPAVDDVAVPSRTVHLPLSWDDPATQEAIRRYMRSVRADAPWCPSNLEFIRRINGLDSVAAVKRTVFAADWLVLGLGDVYLGAPVATPLDPRHRLVTTKYNPARTWTPENAVGIGGAYLCVYGMEGPGGYQFVGRTVPVWNAWTSTASFAPGTPWLLRCFDRIRFHEVAADELLRLRRGVLTGDAAIASEDGVFRWADQRRFLGEHAASIAAFQRTQRAAFAEERARWAAETVAGAAPAAAAGQRTARA